MQYTRINTYLLNSFWLYGHTKARQTAPGKNSTCIQVVSNQNIHVIHNTFT